MIGINFEKNSRPKNKEQNYIKEEIAKYEYPEHLDNFDSTLIEEDKLSVNSNRPVGFYNDESRSDINEGLKSVIAMRPGPKKDKLFSELKENFIRQQKGIAVLKDKLFKEIDNSNRIDLEKINEIITENDRIYEFSQAQMLAIKNMTRDFLRKNQIVNNFYNNYKNPNKLYQQLYNAEPIGKVWLRKGPISLALICNDVNDYARMYANDNSGRRQLDDKEKKQANMSAGFFAWSSPRGFPELKGTIIGVKKTEYSHVNTIINHEEQHAVNKIYLDNIQPIRKDGLSSALYFCNNKEEMIETISSYCHYLIDNASYRAKDEILAYKTENQDDILITRALANNREHGGLYDYFNVDETMKSIENICNNGVLKQHQKELLNLAEKILKDKYKTLIENGLAAVNNLKNKNYSHASITALLMPQALENWLKTAKRTDFSDVYSNAQNELRNILPNHKVEDLEDLKQNLLE